MKRIKLFSILLIVFISSIFLISCSPGGASGSDSLETLATCLTDSGAELYGAYWCSHCKQQKDLFGDAVEFLPYVECTEEIEYCAQKGIQGYPTWIFGDDTRAVGGQSLESLAELSGCEY